MPELGTAQPQLVSSMDRMRLTNSLATSGVSPPLTIGTKADGGWSRKMIVGPILGLVQGSSVAEGEAS